MLIGYHNYDIFLLTNYKKSGLINTREKKL